MKCFRLKSAMFVGIALLALYAGQADAVEADAGEPQVVAMHDVTDPNGPVDPNLLDPTHPAWPMAFATNPNSPIGPIPVVVKLNGSTADPNVGVTVTWSVTDAAQASHVSIDDAGVLDPNVTFDDPNLYSLTLAVDDGTSVETDTVLIKVKLAGNALQAHWKFDGDPNDPNDYDWNYTTYTGNPGFGPGLVGNAMIFKPGDSSSYGKAIGAETDISVAFWIKPSSDFIPSGNLWAEDTIGLIRKYAGDVNAAPGGWTFELRSEGNMRWRCSSGYGEGTELYVNGNYSVNTWTHIAATYDSNDRSMKFYLNATLAQEGIRQGSCFDAFINEMVVGSEDFAGMIDDLYLFDYPLDANEVTALFNKREVFDLDVQLDEQVTVLLPTTEVPLKPFLIGGVGTPTVAWTVLDKPDGSTATIGDDTALHTTVQLDSLGSYRLHLSVTDQATPPDTVEAEIVVKVRPEGFDGLEAHFTFNDQTANSNLATSIPYVGEIFGNPEFFERENRPGDYGVWLDGVDDHINFEDTYLGSDPSCTIALWVGDEDQERDAHIIQKWASDMSGRGFFLRHRPDDTGAGIAVQIGSGFGGGADNTNVTGVYLPYYDWTHLTLTFDEGVASLYKNGVKEWSKTISPSFSTADSVTPMVIGYRWNNGTRFFMGAIDDVRIYDYALTPEAMEALYNAEKPN